jgi:dienelactone hydrolase
LAGRSDGQPVTIADELRIPKAGNDKLPAVILLHGSGGISGAGSMIDEWSRELNQLGIATFAIDSFAARGIVSTVMDQTQLGRLNMVADAYRALDLLAKHSRIDSNRVAVMGFSRGGQSALYSAMNRLYGTLGPANNLRFAAHADRAKARWCALGITQTPNTTGPGRHGWKTLTSAETRL